MRPTLLIVCALALAGALAAPAARTADKPKEKPKPPPGLDDTLRLAATAVGAYLYEAHQKVGLLSDGVAAGTYTAAAGEKELNVSLGLLKAVDKRLAALEGSELKADERTILAEAREVIKLEVDSAESLRAYWKKKAKADGDAFTKHRAAASIKLQMFLRVDKAAGKKKDAKKPGKG
jgi:hypothetical protein